MNAVLDGVFSRARAVFVLMALALAGGIYAYSTIPREGAPNIDIPILYVSVPFPGVSVEDGENLVAKPLEDELLDLPALEEATTFVSEGHIGVLLEFDIGFDKKAATNEVRARIDQIRPEFPEDVKEATVSEVNLAQLPIVSIALSGNVPERPLVRAAEDLQQALVNLGQVESADIFGTRQEVIEIVVDPLYLESYDASVNELLLAVSRNNALVQAGSVTGDQGEFSVKLDGTYSTVREIQDTPFLTDGERTVTFGDIAEIRRTYAERRSLARINGERAIVLQVVKALGENVIETVSEVRRVVDEEVEGWPQELQAIVQATPAIDESVDAKRQIAQLENSVITAIAVILVLAVALIGLRPALLVSSAVPLPSW